MTCRVVPSLFLACASLYATKTEQFVASKVAAGEVADVSGFPDRTISAAFLESLLTKKAGIHRNGIQINGAVFSEAMDVKYIDVPWPVSLTNCEFKGYVDLSGSHFHSSLSLDGSYFDGDLVAVSARIDGHFTADGATFYRGSSFNSAQIKGNASFKNVFFEGPADFVAAQVDIAFDASGSQFTFHGTQDDGTEPGAAFNGMVVGHIAKFDDTIFEGGADFKHMNIVRNYEAAKIRFTGTQKADFSNLHAGAGLILLNPSFSGSVDLSGIQVNKLTIEDGYWPTPANFECSDLSFAILDFPGRLTPSQWAAKPRYSPALYVKFAKYFVSVS